MIEINMEGSFENITQQNKVLKVKLLYPDSEIPTRGSKFAAGYDLYSYNNDIIIIPPNSRALVKTGIAITVPHGTYGRIAPRSGLSLKNNIDTGGGVIDEDYGGEVGVILINHGTEPFIVTKGDRIAQLIIEKIEMIDILTVDELDKFDRGTGGFGSTGKN